MKRNRLLFIPVIIICGLIAHTALARNFAKIDIISEIKGFNQSVISTQPEHFKSKMQLMSDGVFPFLRGTAHLMNKDMNMAPGLEFLRKAPTGLVAGDLHMHNFSIFKVNGKNPTYAIDDLDEAFSSAPLSYDVFRLAVSIVIGFEDRISRENLKPALEQLFAGYCARAADKNSYDWPNIPMAGFIKEFIADESDVKWGKFIKKKTTATKPNRFDMTKHEAIPDSEKNSVMQAMRGYLNQIASSNRIPLEDTEILDVAQRYNKGLSSIGLKRYFVLLRGSSDSIEDNRILEVKIMRTSSVGNNTVEKQSKDTLEAMARAHQARDQYLGTVKIGGKAFLVKQNFPWSETIENVAISDAKKVAQLAHMLGYITADFHSQSGRGPAMKIWLEKSGAGMIPWVFAYVDQIKADWKTLKSTRF